MNILVNLVNSFTPSDEVLRQANPDLDFAEAFRRVRIVIWFTFLGSILILSMFFVRVALEGIQNKSLIMLLVIGVIFGFLPYFIKKTGRFIGVFWFFFGCAAIVLPIRVLATGGLSSSTTGWFMLYAPLGFYTMSIRGGIIAFAVTVIELILLSQAENLGIPVQVFDAAPNVRFAVILIGILIISSLMYAHERERSHSFYLLKKNEKNLAKAQKDSSVKQLAGGVAHNINNPLTVVISRIQLLRRDLQTGGVSKEDMLYSLDKVESNSYRIKNIVDEISILTESSLNNDVEDLNLEDILNEVSRRLNHKLSNGAISLKISNSSNKVNLLASNELISKVFFNILDNSVNNLASQVSGNIEVNLRMNLDDERGPMLLVGFTDNGPGYPEFVKNRLLDPYYMDKEFSKGSGMGLALVKTIVEKYNGVICFEKQNEFDEFIVAFPVS